VVLVVADDEGTTALIVRVSKPLFFWAASLVDVQTRARMAA